MSLSNKKLLNKILKYKELEKYLKLKSIEYDDKKIRLICHNNDVILNNSSREQKNGKQLFKNKLEVFVYLFIELTPLLFIGDNIKELKRIQIKTLIEYLFYFLKEENEEMFLSENIKFELIEKIIEKSFKNISYENILVNLAGLCEVYPHADKV